MSSANYEADVFPEDVSRLGGPSAVLVLLQETPEGDEPGHDHQQAIDLHWAVLRG